jgi:peptidyl-prolyl cis-trans isomerase C
MRRSSDGNDRITLAAATAAAAWLACGACSPAARPSASEGASPAAGARSDLSRLLPSPVPDVVARVNGQPIRLAQLVPGAKNELKRPSVADPEQRKAQAVRRALQQCVERELLLQEALARGVAADDRQVGWSYDQLRREYPDDAAWTKFLAGEGLDPQSIRAELRALQTIGALLEREAKARGLTVEEARAALLGELRSKARIELFL